MGWRVKAKLNKLVVIHPLVPERPVIKIRREVELIPRWRVASSQTVLAFMSGALLTSGQVLLGAVTGALALFLTWAAIR